MSPRPLKLNPQEGCSPGSSHMPDPSKDYSMFSAPSPEPAWMAPPSTSGWTPHSTHSPPSSLKAVQAPLQRRPGCKQTQVCLLSPLLLDLATLLPPPLLLAIWLNHSAPSLNLVLSISRWTPGVSTLQRSRKCSSILISGLRAWIMLNPSIPTQLRRTQFSAHLALSRSIQQHRNILEGTSPSPKVMDSPSPSQPILPSLSSSHCLCSSTGYFGCWCYCGWQCMEEEEGSGTFWNITWHDTCLCWSFLLSSPSLSIPHDTCPSGGKNHMHDLPVSFAHGPAIQRPGNCCRPFNTSNGPSCWSIVVVVESKAALVALLPLALQISHLIDSLPSSIMVESFCLLYGGLCLSTTNVPTPSDLSRVETFMCTLVP